MLNLKKLFIGVVSIISISSQVLAKDSVTYIVMDSQLNNNGQKILFKTSVWYSQEKVRMEHDLQNSSEINIPQNMSKSILLFDLKDKNVFLMMPNNKTALKMNEETMKKIGNNPLGGQIPSNLNTDFLYDNSKIRDEIKKLGGKMTGSEKVLNHLCDIWEYSVPMTNPQTQEKDIFHSKVWISNKLNIPLKIEINSASKGKIMSIKAKELKEEQKFNDDIFLVPKDYQITDMQKMMKEILQLQQNKSN
jgi:outer membrane lipoprotein-sorting protein